MENNTSFSNKTQENTDNCVYFEIEDFEKFTNDIKKKARLKGFKEGSRQRLNFELRKKARRAYKEEHSADREERTETIKERFTRYYNETAHKIPRKARYSYRQKLNALAANNGRHRKLRQDNQAKKLGITTRTLRNYDNHIRDAGLLLSIQSTYKDKNGNARRGALIWYHPDEVRKMHSIPNELKGKLPEDCRAFSTGKTFRSLFYSFDISPNQNSSTNDEGTVGTRREGESLPVEHDYPPTENYPPHSLTKEEESLSGMELVPAWEAEFYSVDPTSDYRNSCENPNQYDVDFTSKFTEDFAENLTDFNRDPSSYPVDFSNNSLAKEWDLSRDWDKLPETNTIPFPGQVKKETPPCKNVTTISENGSTAMRENISSDDLERHSKKDSQRNTGHHSLSSYYFPHCSQLTKRESIPTFSLAHTKVGTWMEQQFWITPIKLTEDDVWNIPERSKRVITDGNAGKPQFSLTSSRLMPTVAHIQPAGLTVSGQRSNPAQLCHGGENLSNSKPISAPELSDGHDDYSNLPKVPEIDVWEPWPPIHTPVEHDEYADFEGDESC